MPLVPPISPVNVLTVPVMLIVPSPAEAPAIAGAIVTLLAPAKTIVAVAVLLSKVTGPLPLKA